MNINYPHTLLAILLLTLSPHYLIWGLTKIYFDFNSVKGDGFFWSIIFISVYGCIALIVFFEKIK